MVINKFGTERSFYSDGFSYRDRDSRCEGPLDKIMTSNSEP